MFNLMDIFFNIKNKWINSQFKINFLPSYNNHFPLHFMILKGIFLFD